MTAASDRAWDRFVARAAAAGVAVARSDGASAGPGGGVAAAKARLTDAGGGAGAVGPWRTEVVGHDPDGRPFVAAAAEAADHSDRSWAAVTALVRGAWDDLARSAEDGAAIDGLAGELGHAYESVRVLYRLGRSMNSLRDSAGFIAGVCDSVLDQTPLGWVVARLADDEAVPSPVRGRLVGPARRGAGAAIGPELARAAMLEARPDRWVLLRPADHAVAREAGSEVLAHALKRDGRVIGALIAGGKSGPDREVTSAETQLLDAVADFASVFLENASLYEAQRALFLGTVRALSAAIDAKDTYTHGHSERVAHLSARLAAAAGLDAESVEQIHLAGLLHDIGKIGVPEAVLCKPGKLTDEEFGQIKRHPRIGHGILMGVPLLDGVLPGVLSHHERWDGRGYPQGLAGGAIPMVARIIGLADSFDAMSSNRSYRPAMPRDRVLAEIAAGAGKQFDPELAPVFMRLDYSEFDRLLADRAAASAPAGARVAA